MKGEEKGTGRHYLFGIYDCGFGNYSIVIRQWVLDIGHLSVGNGWKVVIRIQ